MSILFKEPDYNLKTCSKISLKSDLNWLNELKASVFYTQQKYQMLTKAQQLITTETGMCFRGSGVTFKLRF
jgi:hypothetical protein